MSKESKNFYVTTPIYYPNGLPHIGHAYTTTVCDVLARYHKNILKDDTYFLTGTDENTSKVVKAAEKAGKDPKQFTNEVVDYFNAFYDQLNIANDQFIRTSDEKVHWPGAKKIWEKLVESGDIYKKSYKGLYCVGAETFVTEKDLVDGKCPDHDEFPTELEEENYFFRLSKYTDKIKEAIESDEIEIVPQSRKNEILSLLNEGLQDVSFSRPQKAIPWGIPVPGDEDQTIYVWCDALTNYVTALGYGRDNEGADGSGGDSTDASNTDSLYQKFWPSAMHVIGKDILRFHAAIWPGMLMSAGIPLPKKILVHGLVLSDGRKMSKTLGNVIDPKKLMDEYGTDALRYYLTREIPSFDDGDMTEERFAEVYNANLVNGIGNLVNRIMKMAEDNLDGPVELSESDMTIPDEYTTAFAECNIQRAADIVWEKVAEADKKIQETEPFKLIKTDPESAKKIITELVVALANVSYLLEPFLPETAEKIINAVMANKKPSEPLFPRKDS
jgi:methionyl-tRNA synthetase